MRWPTCRPGGAVLVVTMLLAWQAADVSAGVVAPPSKAEAQPVGSDGSSATALPAAAVSNSLPLPGADDPQPFWYPGVDPVVSVSSVPIAAPQAVVAPPGDQQHPLIPLPGAAWTGMAGLASLGAIKFLRNLRRLLA